MKTETRYAKTKDSACDITASGMSGKTLEWFIKKFITNGSYSAPSASLSSSDIDSRVEAYSSFSTSNTLKLSFTKNDCGGIDTANYSTLRYVKAGDEDNTIDPVNLTPSFADPYTSVLSKTEFSLNIPFDSEGDSAKMVFYPGANKFYLEVPYLSGSATKNYQININGTKSDTGVLDTANKIVADSLEPYFTVTGGYRIFQSNNVTKGLCSGATVPTSTQIRAFGGDKWEGDTKLTLSVTTSSGCVAFAVPSTVTVDGITNQNNQSVKSSFSNKNVTVTMPDGNTTKSYKLWYYESANATFGAADTFTVTLK